MRLAIRPHRDSDRPFIVGSWLSSYRRSPYAGLISMGDWSGMMGAVVARILDTPTVRVLVAVDLDAAPGDSDLFGWLAWMERPAAPPLVFYVYVKQMVRYDRESRTGPRIATRLFRAAGIDPRSAFHYASCTHIVGALRAAGKIRNAKFTPLAGRFPKEKTDGSARPEDPDSDAA